jgi:hypothetical protein
MFVWTFVKRAVGIVFVVSGLLLFGMKGLLIGMVLNTWFSYFVNIGMVSKYIGYKWTNQLLDILPIMIASAIVAFISYYIALLFDLQLYADGVIKFLVYISLYMTWSYVFKPEAYGYTKAIIAPMLSKLKRKIKR